MIEGTLKCSTHLEDSEQVDSLKDCASRQLLDRIGDAWSVLIVSNLRGGPLRFTELSRKMEG